MLHPAPFALSTTLALLLAATLAQPAAARTVTLDFHEGGDCAEGLSASELTVADGAIAYRAPNHHFYDHCDRGPGILLGDDGWSAETTIRSTDGSAFTVESVTFSASADVFRVREEVLAAQGIAFIDQEVGLDGTIHASGHDGTYTITETVERAPDWALAHLNGHLLAEAGTHAAPLPGPVTEATFGLREATRHYVAPRTSRARARSDRDGWVYYCAFRCIGGYLESVTLRLASTTADQQPAPTPLPAAGLMLAAALGALGWRSRRRA